MPDRNVQLQKHNASITSLRYFFLVSLAFSIIGLVIDLPSAYGSGSFFGFSGRKLLELFPIFLSLFLGALGIVLIQTQYTKALNFLSWRVFRFLRNLGMLNWVVWIILIISYGIMFLTDIVIPVFSTTPQIWIFGHIAILGALILCGAPLIKPLNSLLITFSVYGILLWVFYFVPDVTSYPLTLAWSEGSHYYYASLIFSRLIYGQQAPLSILNPSRYLLQSIPFIVPSLPLWFHRLWQVMLWLGLTIACALALTKRINPTGNVLKLAVTAWFFMFIFQGPVYYQLLIVVLIILLGFKRENLWLSLGFVIIASLWAGISRVNWFPVAGMLAVTLYVLENPYDGKTFWQYWRWPIMAVIVGMALAFSSQAVYVVLSGQPPEFFVMSFGMPLFVYRLLPNEAYGLGVIVWTLIAIAPALLIIFWCVVPRLSEWKILRLMALLAILVALMVAGLVVSTRIGGGNNIHNMDSFLVALAVITVYVASNRFVPDHPRPKQDQLISFPLVMFAFIIPLISVVNMLRPLPDLDKARAWSDIRQVERFINDFQSENGEILFIHQRHLLAFNMLEDIELVVEYEKVDLMEMAMASNEIYLSEFWEDLENHRFDLIVSEPLRIVFRPSTDRFAEENNAWVESIAVPLLDSYEILTEMLDSNMVVMVPKSAD